jgi:hypothetical protein
MRKQLCQGELGPAELVYRKGNFYLHISITIPAPEVKQPQGSLGVDLGSRRVAMTSDKLCPDNVRRQRVYAGDHQPGLDRMAAQRACADHRRMTDGDGQMNGKAFGDRRDERAHVVDEAVLVFLGRARMAVIIGRRKGHRDVLERERDRGGLVQLQLVERDQRLIFQHARIDHH